VSARLFARFGPEKGFELEFAREATIGRGQDNTARLTSREVSQHHARVYYDVESAAWWLEDLGSLNGTRLDGEPVTGRERLDGLHVIGFGPTAELFFVELAGTGAAPEREPTRIDHEVPTLPTGLQAKSAEAAAAGAAGSATRIEQMPVDLPPGLASTVEPAEPAVAAPRFALELADRPGERFELHEGDNLVGRSGGARIVLAYRELSRRHATLRVAGGRVWLRDEGSRNHTYVADEEVTDEVEIDAGSELRFGRLRARLVAAEPTGGEAAAAGPPDAESG
jgi:pSer/pThr/pTyr-binding forkhead associated (FHA) protein